MRLTPGMSHLKAMLIDGERLIVGSSNFDFVSWACEEELAAVIRQPGLIADFQARIIDPALAEALPLGPRAGPFSGLAAGAALRIAALVAGAARHAPRGAVEWRSTEHTSPEGGTMHLTKHAVRLHRGRAKGRSHEPDRSDLHRRRQGPRAP